MDVQPSSNEGLRELALFAGAGGGILGGKLLGWRTVCAVERDAYAAQVLAQRQNDGILEPFPIWSDITSFDGKPWRGIVDVVSGGFPCQAFSSAARGRNNARDFWPEMQRVIAQIRPRYVFAENVSKYAIERAAIDCRIMGYKTKAISLSAKDVGADHERERFWLLAHANMCSKFFGKEYAETSMLPEFRRTIWDSFPDKFRMADGMAHKMDRLKATGNGQIPFVAATAFTILRERIEQ